MKKFLYFLVISLIFISCSKSVTGVKVITQEEMQTFLKMDEVQLVDVRSPEEYKTGFIANAQNIDYFSDTFEEDMTKLDKNRPVILYCKSGSRSAKCAKKLISAGFIKVYDFEGGISKWKHSGLELTTNL